MTTLQVLPEGGFCFVVTWPCQMVIVQSVVNPRMGDSVPFDPSAIAMFVTTSIVFWVLLAGVDMVFTAARETLCFCLYGPLVITVNADAV